MPLLADVDKDVARKYDAFSSRLGVKRAVIVIDEQGIVRHRHDHLLGLDFQSVDELKAGWTRCRLRPPEYANCVRGARTESGWRAWFAMSKTWRIVRVRAYARA